LGYDVDFFVTRRVEDRPVKGVDFRLERDEGWAPRAWIK